MTRGSAPGPALSPALPIPAELHVLDGVPSFIFVAAKYTIEVGLQPRRAAGGGWGDAVGAQWVVGDGFPLTNTILS